MIKNARQNVARSITASLMLSLTISTPLIGMSRGRLLRAVQVTPPTPQQSVESSLEYLRRVMDQYHNRIPVSEDVSSAGNHFHAFGKIPIDTQALGVNGSSTNNPHAGATAIRVAQYSRDKLRWFLSPERDPGPG
jgi:hypothetical protein